MMIYKKKEEKKKKVERKKKWRFDIYIHLELNGEMAVSNDE